jgi:hypothetical protein
VYNNPVDSKKRVLIIFDGTDPIENIAKSIAAALNDCDIKMCSGETFAGTDLLPAGVFILGCENPEPPSFDYLSMLLKHINLVDRKCGIFSTNEKALKYLSGLVEDCEALVLEPLLAEDGNVNLETLARWLQGIN